jgi:hypothetical protein
LDASLFGRVDTRTVACPCDLPAPPLHAAITATSATATAANPPPAIPRELMA